MLYCNTFRPELLRIVTEIPDFARRLPKLFKRAFNLEFDQIPGDGGGKLIFQITDSRKMQTIYDAFGLSADGGVALHVKYGML